MLPMSMATTPMNTGKVAIRRTQRAAEGFFMGKRFLLVSLMTWISLVYFSVTGVIFHRKSELFSLFQRLSLRSVD